MELKPGSKWKDILIKALIVQVVFVILHFAYDWAPGTLTRIFSGTSEAVFQHMKIGFFSYGAVSLVEFILKRGQVEDSGSYGMARLASSVFYCWPMFILFFAPPAYYGKYPADIYEIISANLILYVTSLIAAIFERELERIKLSREFRGVIVILALVLISLLVIYSFRDPWFDLFAIPPGWE